MNTQLFKAEIQQIRARNQCPIEGCREAFQFIQLVVHQLDGGPVTSEFKQALREELDAAYQGLGGDPSLN